MIDDDACPGTGKCHGCMQWCDDCGDVKHVCDARLNFSPCDAHPIPPEWQELRKRRRDAEHKLLEAQRLEREARAELSIIKDDEAARAAYGKQLEAEENKLFNIQQAEA